jgi:hypothetical protein
MTVTDSPTLTPTNTSTPTFTATRTYTPSYTSTGTFTITCTFTVTPTFTISPTPYGPDRIDITIYDPNGVTVKELPETHNAVIIHNAALSSNPFHADGTRLLVISDGTGLAVGGWDGKNLSGNVVSSGTYIIRIKTTDIDGNVYTVDETVDVILDNSYAVDSLQIIYHGGDIRIKAVLLNAGDVSLKIYNMAGELIKGFAVPNPSNLDIYWDKKTTSGQSASSGIYIVLIEFRDINTGYKAFKTEKMAITR